MARGRNRQVHHLRTLASLFLRHRDHAVEIAGKQQLTESLAAARVRALADKERPWLHLQFLRGI